MKSQIWRCVSIAAQVCAGIIATAITLMVAYYTVRTYNLAAWTATKDFCEYNGGKVRTKIS